MATSYPGAIDALTNPTGTDQLSSPSHADQHANANDAIEAIQTRVGTSGTSFPGSPVSGQRFLRTDRNMEYFYDGSRWVSTALFSYTIDASATAATSATGVLKNNIDIPRPSGYLIHVVYCQAVYTVAGGGTALSASHKWGIQFNYFPADAALAGVTIDSGASATQRRTEGAANTVTTSSNVAGYLLATKTGTPGNFQCHAFQITYRVIG